VPISASDQTAPELAPTAWASLRTLADRRATLAGYRISEALIAALDAAAP
jgi:hypothetical protein